MIQNDIDDLTSSLRSVPMRGAEPGAVATFVKKLAYIVDSISVSGGGGTVTSDTPPASPVDGTFWWDSISGNLFVWYDDGTSAQWVIANNLVTGSGGGGGGTAQIFNEIPPESIDGSNTFFSTANNYASGEIRIFLNGIRQYSATYTETGSNTFSLGSAPLTGDVLTVDYTKA